MLRYHRRSTIPQVALSLVTTPRTGPSLTLARVESYYPTETAILHCSPRTQRVPLHTQRCSTVWERTRLCRTTYEYSATTKPSLSGTMLEYCREEAMSTSLRRSTRRMETSFPVCTSSRHCLRMSMVIH